MCYRDRGKFISGLGDYTWRVWAAVTGAHAATLTGHGAAVYGLAIFGDRVYSASWDGTIRSWAAGTWSLERTVRACAEDAYEYPCCVAVSGGQPVSGSPGDPWEGRGPTWSKSHRPAHSSPGQHFDRF